MDWVILICVMCAIVIVCSLLDKLSKRLQPPSAMRGKAVKSEQSKVHKNRVTCASYSVKGKNPATGRVKKVSVIVESTATETEIQQKSGLLPPYEITENPPEKPTENQVAYAQKLNFSFPPDATKQDASIFLTRLENDMPLYPSATPDKMLRYAIGKGIEIPAYAGREETRNLYFYGITEAERAAYFCMKVYCNIKKKSYGVLEDAEQWERELFYEFAEQHKDDKEFVRSLSHYFKSRHSDQVKPPISLGIGGFTNFLSDKVRLDSPRPPAKAHKKRTGDGNLVRKAAISPMKGVDSVAAIRENVKNGKALSYRFIACLERVRPDRALSKVA